MIASLLAVQNGPHTQTGLIARAGDNIIITQDESGNGKGWVMRAVITVIGKDMVGILANVSAGCAEANANIIEVTQSVLREFFCMVMLIDVGKMNVGIREFEENLRGRAEGMEIHVMHEDIFNSMHRI
jgi:ACT domain-containing protein